MRWTYFNNITRSNNLSSGFFISLFQFMYYCLIHMCNMLLTSSKSKFIIQSMSISSKPTKRVSLDDLPDLLTISEVAELLRVSPLTIKRWGKKGKLPAIRINSRGDRRYKKDVVLRLLGVSEE